MGYIVQISAILLFLLAVLVLLKERKAGGVSLAAGLILLALIQVLDLLALRGPAGLPSLLRTILVLKTLMPVMFLLYGMSYRKKAHAADLRPLTMMILAVGACFIASALTLPLGLFYASVGFTEGLLVPLGSVGYWFYLGLMIFCIAALVNLESVFAGIRGADRWRVKYEFLGVGAILAVMIFYFSQGLLYKSVNMGLLTLRSGVVMLAAFLIGYSRLYRGRTANIAVSRQALYRSFSLAAVGIYLLVLGLLGEGMKRYNIRITRDLSVFVAILTGVAFLVLLLSEEIRRRLKVFLAKNFYAQKHDYREVWLEFSNALARCRGLEEVRTAIVERYEQIFGVRFAVLYGRESGGDSFALAAAQDKAGLPARVTLTAGLLGYFVETGRVMNSADGEYTLTGGEATFVRDADGWLLVPLLAGEHLEAFVLLGRQVVPEKLTYEDFDLMKTIGRQAVLSLNNFRLSEELAEAREMAAVAKVSAFVIHDLKNLAYTFSLMMENAESHIGEADFQVDLVKSIRSTVAKMNALIAKLKAFPEKMELKREAVDIARVAQETLEEIRRVKPAIAFQAECAPVEAQGDAQEMRKVVLNLLLNACDAVGEQGPVVLKTGSRDGEAFFSVEDNGCGMSKTFVENHLFRPFRTTKEKGLGIGLYQCKQIVEAHGGRIEVESREGAGTVFTVVLPALGTQLTSDV